MALYVAEGIPNMWRLKIFTMSVLWMVATHVVTLVAIPFVVPGIYKGREWAVLLAAGVVTNVAINRLVTRFIIKLGGREFEGTILLCVATLVILFIDAVLGMREAERRNQGDAA